MPRYCDRETIQTILAPSEAYPQRIQERVDAIRQDRGDPVATTADYVSAWNAELDKIIGKFSEYIDGEVGNSYQYAYYNGTQKFPNVTDTPATPAKIYEICRLLCLDGALEYYHPAQVLKKSFEGQMPYREQAEKELESIRNKEVSVKVVSGQIQDATPTSTSTLVSSERVNKMTDCEFDRLR